MYIGRYDESQTRDDDALSPPPSSDGLAAASRSIAPDDDFPSPPLPLPLPLPLHRCVGSLYSTLLYFTLPYDPSPLLVSEEDRTKPNKQREWFCF